MNADQHRLKAERIERSLAKCGPTDWEIRIEACMLAGTHWANYALHRQGLTAPAEDIVHTSMLVMNHLRKYALAQPQILRDLDEIEELRPLYVRGDLPDGARAADQAVALLARISGLARQL